ncbi:MAG: hypothetical protein QM479_08980 [Pseudomonadota bacterium]
MKKNILFSIVVITLLTTSCKNKETSINNALLPKPDVTIVNPIIGNIQENTQINGQVIFLNRTTIMSPISGYVIAVNTKLGDWVKKGKLLFKIQTKESKALQSSSIATSNEFGIIPVYASASGYVNTLSISDSGVFISEGNNMATIVKNEDLVIQVNVPFQFNKLLINNKNIEIELPNKECKAAYFYKAMPLVDPVSQTQQIYFKLNKYTLLPENLNVIVKIPNKQKKNTTILPKNAILTNETQDKFWILKVTKDSLAIIIPVTKGLENNSNVEILNPKLKITDKIIEKGGYGLPDSTKVKIN